jgi:hypothetical protein
LRLTELASARAPRLTREQVAHVARSMLFPAVFVTVGFPVVCSVGNWWTETHGANSLARPSTVECAIAHTMAEGLRHREASTLTDPGWSADLKARIATHAMSEVDLQGFSPGPGYATGAHGGDWRWCRGMGAFVRGLGFARMGQSSFGATFAIDRPWISSDGTQAQVVLDYRPPWDVPANVPTPPTKALVWREALTLDRASGRWTVVGRSAL